MSKTRLPLNERNQDIREWQLVIIRLDAANVVRSCSEQCFHQQVQ